MPYDLFVVMQIDILFLLHQALIVKDPHFVCVGTLLCCALESDYTRVLLCVTVRTKPNCDNNCKRSQTSAEPWDGVDDRLKQHHKVGVTMLQQPVRKQNSRKCTGGCKDSHLKTLLCIVVRVVMASAHFRHRRLSLGHA